MVAAVQLTLQPMLVRLPRLRTPSSVLQRPLLGPVLQGAAVRWCRWRRALAAPLPPAPRPPAMPPSMAAHPNTGVDARALRALAEGSRSGESLKATTLLLPSVPGLSEAVRVGTRSSSDAVTAPQGGARAAVATLALPPAPPQGRVASLASFTMMPESMPSVTQTRRPSVLSVLVAVGSPFEVTCPQGSQPLHRPLDLTCPQGPLPVPNPLALIRPQGI